MSRAERTIRQTLTPLIPEARDDRTRYLEPDPGDAARLPPRRLETRSRRPEPLVTATGGARPIEDERPATSAGAHLLQRRDLSVEEAEGLDETSSVEGLSSKKVDATVTAAGISTGQLISTLILDNHVSVSVDPHHVVRSGDPATIRVYASRERYSHDYKVAGEPLRRKPLSGADVTVRIYNFAFKRYYEFEGKTDATGSYLATWDGFHLKQYPGWSKLRLRTLPGPSHVVR